MSRPLALLAALFAVVVALAVGWPALRGASAPREANRVDPADAPEPAQLAPPPARSALRSDTGARAPRGLDPLVLTGRVIARGGAPIAGATVELQRSDAAGFALPDSTDRAHRALVATATSAADGGFAFAVAHAQAFDVHAHATGFAAETVPHCCGGMQLEIELLRGATLEGTVVGAGDGSAISGALVALELLAARDALPALERMTGPDGTYRFEGIAPGPVRLRVEPRAAQLWQSHTLGLEPGETRRLDVVVQPGATVRGTVTDARSGLPIGGAEVSLAAAFRGSIAATNANGAYALRGVDPPRSARVHVRARGYAAQSKVLDGGAAESARLDFALDPAGLAQGRVLDADGTPLSDAYVAAIATWSAPPPASEETDFTSARTSRDGRFALRDLRTGVRHALFVRHPGRGTAVLDFPRPAAAGETIELGDVVLHAGAIVEGRIVDEERAPIARAEVRLRGPASPAREERPGGWRVALRTAASGDDGRFRFADLAPGTYEIEATQGAVRVTRAIDVPMPAALVAGVEIALELGLGLSGQVVAPDGQPPPAGRVHVRPETPGTAGSWPHSAEVFGDGRFAFWGLPPGTYTIEAAPRAPEDREALQCGSGTVCGVAAGTSGIRVQLARLAWIEGIVVNAAGAPVAGISVRALLTGTRRSAAATVRTGEQGNFRLMVTDGETCDLEAGVPLALGAVRGSYVPAPDPRTKTDVTAVRAGATGLVIRLE